MDHPNGWMPTVLVLEHELERLTSLVDSRCGGRYPEETDAPRVEARPGAAKNLLEVADIKALALPGRGA